MNKILVITVLLLFSTAVFAQKASIKGTVIDSTTKAPVEMATVAIVNAKDTSLISYTITQKTGEFKLTGIPADKETRLLISFVGYNTFRKLLVLKPGIERDLGPIALSGKNLSEVLIRGERSPITMRKDTIEFNAEAFKTRPNAVVEDLLRTLPGVQVNYDGTITVNGKTISKLLINGKRFFGNDPKVASKNLDADMIDKVQVYDDREDDPDHKLSDAEVGKIINLKMKSKIKKSTLGKIYGGIGSRDRYEVGGIVSTFRDTLQMSVIGLANNLNKTGFSSSELYSMGGFNRSGGSQVWDGTFGGRGWGGMENVISTGFNINNNYGERLKMNLVYFYTNTRTNYNGNYFNEQTLKETILSSSSQSTSQQNSEKHAIGGLIEWKPDTLRHLRYEPKVNFSPQNSFYNSSGISFNTQTPKLNEAFGDGSSKSFNNSFSHDFMFWRRLKKKGESITINHSLSLSKGGSEGLSYNSITSYVSSINSQIFDRSSNNNTINNSANLAVTYNYPINKKLTAELYSNTRYITSFDKALTFDKNPVTGDYDLPYFSLNRDLTRYSFIQNFKPQFSYELNKKTTIRLGVDFETQYIKNEFNTAGVADIGKKYYFLFPVVRINISGISFTYSEYIQQPQISQMQPIERVYNELYKSTGNPDLVPSRLHNAYLSFYKYNYDKQLNTNLYSSFTITDNNIVSRTTVATNGARTDTYVNRNGGWSGYAGGSIGKQFKKSQKWQVGVSSSLSVNLNRNAFFLNGDEGTQNSYWVNATEGINFNYNSIISFNNTYNLDGQITNYGKVDYASVSTLKHTVGTDVTVRWPKRIIFDAKYGYSFNPQVAQGFPKSSNILNMAVTFLMFKKDRGQLKLSVYDLLDQNISVYRYAGTNSISTSEQQILKRYFLINYQFKISSYK